MSNRSLLLSACALCWATACSRATAESRPRPAAPPPIRIARATVAEAATADILVLTGRIVADQRAEVTASTQGKVTAVRVHRGQRLRQGDRVIGLDVHSAAIRESEASAQLAAARAEAELASAECARARRLFAQGAITKSEADRAATRCASAGSQVKAAAARAHVLAQSVRDGWVRAPFDGVVAETLVTAGEWVSPGRPLFTLVDTDPLTIELSVPESHLRSVAIGQAVKLSTIARPGATYRATVTRIGAEIGRSRSLIVEATIEPTTELLPGMFAEARVVVGHTRRPAIPASAAIERGNDWHVFVVHDTELEDRIVRLGPAPAPGRVSVLQGLGNGEVVVREPSPQTVDGLSWVE